MKEKETSLNYNWEKSKALSQIKENLDNESESDVEDNLKEFFIWSEDCSFKQIILNEKHAVKNEWIQVHNSIAALKIKYH